MQEGRSLRDLTEGAGLGIEGHAHNLQRVLNLLVLHWKEVHLGGAERKAGGGTFRMRGPVGKGNGGERAMWKPLVRCKKRLMVGRSR